MRRVVNPDELEPSLYRVVYPHRADNKNLDCNLDVKKLLKLMENCPVALDPSMQAGLTAFKLQISNLHWEFCKLLMVFIEYFGLLLK